LDQRAQLAAHALKTPKVETFVSFTIRRTALISCGSGAVSSKVKDGQAYFPTSALVSSSLHWEAQSSI